MRNANDLLELINDILDLAKVEAGRLTLVRETFHVRDCVEDCLAMMEPLAESRGIQLNMEVANDLPTPYTDRARLKQILINLLSNAVKFTEKGSVTVQAFSNDDFLVISVKDTGIGIPESQREEIFEAFRQGGAGGFTCRWRHGAWLGSCKETRLAFGGRDLSGK